MPKKEGKRHVAWLLVAVGGAVAVGGIALVYIPAAAIIGGLAVAAFGLFGVDAE